jgi:hypothetical protein
MKHLYALLLLGLCATSSAQSIKALGYNTTNGQIVAATNVVWTNAFTFSTNNVAAQVRTNLSLPWTGLTNANADTFLTALRLAEDISSTNLLTITAARHLYDETGQGLSLKGDDGEFTTSASFVTTNAPADSTNAVKWLILTEGTNSYRVPLYQ